MPGAVIAAAVGTLGAAYIGKRATENAAAQMERLGREGQLAQEWAFKALPGFAMDVLAPQMTRVPVSLAAGHEEAARGIARAARIGEATSRRFWTSTGNLGRGRGEQMRLRRATAEAQGREKVRFATALEAHRAGARAQFGEALSTTAQLGQMGTAAQISAAQTRGQAGAAFASDVAGVLGGLYGAWQMEREPDWERQMLNRLFPVQPRQEVRR